MTTLLIKHYLNNNEWNFFHKSRRIRFKSTAYIDTKCNYSHNNQILSYIRSIILDYTPNHFERQNNILPKIFRTKLFSAKADVYDSLINTVAHNSRQNFFLFRLLNISLFPGSRCFRAYCFRNYLHES